MAKIAPCMIWTVSGPPGAGKTTLIGSLLGRFSHAKPLLRIVTRAPRANDNPGEYEYLAREEFESRASKGEFLWPVEIHGSLNGIRQSNVDEALLPGHVTTVDMNPANASRLIGYVHERSKGHLIRSIFLDIRDEEKLSRRMEERGTGDIDKRLEESRGWRKDAMKSPFPFCFIDARKSKDEVFFEAVEYFTRS